MIEKIAVIGAGAFGLALAKVFSGQAKNICLWDKDFEVVDYINTHHKHQKIFSNIVFEANIKAGKDIDIVIKSANIIILAIPTGALKDVLPKMSPFIDKKSIVLNVAKGIDKDGLRLPADLIKEFLPKESFLTSAYLSGPSFAKELMDGLYFGADIASYDTNTLNYLKNNLENKQFKIHESCDVIGVCLGGAIKNVMAIAIGLCSGLNFGKNAKALLSTKALEEMIALGVAMHAKPKTLYGLCGLGDLLLSSADDMSRNFRLGYLLAQGQTLSKALETIGSTVEGVETASSIKGLGERYQIDLPICLGVYNILFNNYEPKNTIELLFN